MRRTRDFKTFIGFGAALLVLTAMGITTYRGARQALADDQLVGHTYEVLEKLQAVLVAIVDLETVARGYVITGQDGFLEPYERTVKGLPNLLQDIQSLTADNPRQQERLATLKPILQAKLLFLTEQLNTRRDRGAESARALVGSGTGKNLMDSIRAVIDAMENEEHTLLRQRIAQNEQSQRWVIVVIVVGNILACVFLAGAVSVIYRENVRRRRAEESAIADQKKLDLILTSLGEGVIAADAAGNFTHFNPMAEHVIGIGATAAPHGTWAERYGVFEPDGVTPYPSDRLPLVRTIRGESCDNVELFVRNSNRPDGVMLSVTGRPLRNEAGTLLGGVVVLSDITERRRHKIEIEQKNEELAQAYAELDRTRLQQLRTKDQLLSHVSHELRTPLTAAYQFVEILRDGLAGELNAEQLEYSEIALRNLKQLRAMIGDLLEATRVESAKLTIEPQRMNLEGAVKEVCRTLYSPAAEKGIAIENRVGALPDVFADANRVRQILTNLLHNAIKFTKKGSVSIDAHVMDEDPRLVRITIADTGCGMGPEALGRLFTRLYQAGDPRAESRQGLGLGLYICKELVTRQGGTIWVESELGKGSTFHCTFPIFSEAANSERDLTHATGNPGHRG
jgi:signal transduction histidine kinase/CHASE3 domain sensor protein